MDDINKIANELNRIESNLKKSKNTKFSATWLQDKSAIVRELKLKYEIQFNLAKDGAVLRLILLNDHRAKTAAVLHYMRAI